MLSPFRQLRGGAPPCVARSWGQGGAAARHDMEVEGVVVKVDAILEFRVLCCTCNAQAHVPKRRGQNRVRRVLQCRLL